MTDQKLYRVSFILRLQISAQAGKGNFKALITVQGSTNTGSSIEASTITFYQGSSITQKLRISVASDGSQGNADSYDPSISADGRYVAFMSVANNLVPNDTNSNFGFYDGSDIFIHDSVTSETTLISRTNDTLEHNHGSFSPSISADSQYVAFGSNASNLVPEDNNNHTDVFIYDRQSSEITRISVSNAGAESNGDSDNPSISTDGRYIAFESDATTIVPGDFRDIGNIFVHDRLTKDTTRVSVSSDGTLSNDHSFNSSISADGRYIVFQSISRNLVLDDTNHTDDIFLHDRLTSKTSRVSISTYGIEGNGYSSSPSISADGRYIVFQSNSNNLVSDDTNDSDDIFIHDRISGNTSRISISNYNVETNAGSFNPTISADGQYILFESYASNLVPGDTNGLKDIYLHDRVTGEITLIATGSDYISNLAINTDGQYIAFGSNSSNLVPDDTNGSSDTFLYKLKTPSLPETEPAIGIQIQVDGKDVTKPGPAISANSNLNWTYTASNDGNTPLHDIEVRARQKLPTIGSWKTICSLGTVEPGNSVSCKAMDLAKEGAYKALIVVRGTTSTGDTIESTFQAFYQGESGSAPALTLNVSANEFSTTKPGPILSEGTSVSWTYSVRNDGQTVLNTITIRGRRKLPTLGNWEALCTIAVIQPGETGNCTTTDSIVAGTYKALIVARTTGAGRQVDATHQAFYVGQ